MAFPKHDYKSKEFLENIEALAKKGLTDCEIAFTIGLSYQRFSEKKTKIREVGEALTRGRNTINQLVRQKYLSLGFGGLKTKSITKKKMVLPDGTESQGDIVFETETELPPNERVLATWLSLHDEEWRDKTIELKKLDVTSNGKDIGIQLVFGSTPLSGKDIEDIKKIESGTKLDESEDRTDASLPKA